MKIRGGGGGHPGPLPWIRHWSGSVSGFENLRENELNYPINLPACASLHLKPYVSQGGGRTYESGVRSERPVAWDFIHY